MTASDGQGGGDGAATSKGGPSHSAEAVEAPALAVIEAFGGIRPMAKQLGVAVSTVQGWKETPPSVLKSKATVSTAESGSARVKSMVTSPDSVVPLGDVTTAPLFEEEYCLVCADDHPLAARDEVASLMTLASP